MVIESARFTVDALELVIDGRRAYSDTKRSLLDAGIAVLLDPDPASPHWEHATSAVLEADPTIGLAVPLVISGGTRDARVVALAREYWDAVNTAGFVERDYRSPKNGEPGRLLAGPTNSQT